MSQQTRLPSPLQSGKALCEAVYRTVRRFRVLAFRVAHRAGGRILEQARLWQFGLARKDRSLQQELGLTLICISLAFIAGGSLLQSWVVMPAFVRLERQGAIRDVKRCLAGVERDLELLTAISSDWGAWDDTYYFVQDRNEKFKETNLAGEMFSSGRFSLLAMLNANRELVWGECRDLETLERIELPGLWPMLTDASFPLTRHERVDDGKRGIVLTGEGPLLMSCVPIVTSKGEGPIRGSMVIGRFFDQQEIRQLASRAEVDLEAWQVGDPLSSQRQDLEVLKELRETGGPVVRVADSKRLLAYAKVDDIFGKPALLLRVNVPREVTAQGNFAGTLATCGGILGCLVIATAAGVLLRRRIVKPVEEIVAHAQHIGVESDLQARLNSGRVDEIGQLAGAFDQMVECLAASRTRILGAAHRAGRADVASEILHNVGNVLSPANIFIEQLKAQMKSGSLRELRKAAELLKQNSDCAAGFFSQDPRGPKLVRFLGRTAARLAEEAKANQASLARIGKAISHIQEIIALQGYQANQRAGFAYETDLLETIREVVTLNYDRLERAGVEVRLDVEPLPELMLNRSKLSQVLVNLVRNAVQAMEAAGEGPRVLRVLARQTGDGGIEIEVRDTGCGLSEEVKANLFRHGFTTKASGQGIGLHYCANAIRSIDGSVAASSEGRGRGASFQIRFPTTAIVWSERLEPAKAA